MDVLFSESCNRPFNLDEKQIRLFPTAILDWIRLLTVSRDAYC